MVHGCVTSGTLRHFLEFMKFYIFQDFGPGRVNSTAWSSLRFGAMSEVCFDPPDWISGILNFGFSKIANSSISEFSNFRADVLAGKIDLGLGGFGGPSCSETFWTSISKVFWTSNQSIFEILKIGLGEFSNSEQLGSPKALAVEGEVVGRGDESEPLARVEELDLAALMEKCENSHFFCQMFQTRFFQSRSKSKLRAKTGWKMARSETYFLNFLVFQKFVFVFV